MTDEFKADDLLDLEEASEDPSAGSVENPPYSSERISDLLRQARDSIVNVEDSELQVIARISAEFSQSSGGAGQRESAEFLRDSEVDDLAVEFEATDEAATAPSDDTSTPAKRENSERVPVMPRTHPLANSIAPTAAVKSVAPPAEARGPFWQIVAAAAAVVALGAGVGQLSSKREARSERASEATGVVVHTAAARTAPEPVLAPQAAQLARQVEAGGSAREQNEEAALAPAVEPSAPEVTPEQPRAIATQAEPESVDHAGTAGEERRARRSRRGKRGRTTIGPVPAQLSRESVVATMRAAMPELARCTGGRKGSVSAQLTVRGSGRVSYALIEGSFAGTPEGTCLAKALREIRFPAFAESSLRLTYPLQF